MGRKVYGKKYTDENVYDAALKRIRYMYDRFDRVIVSFSGGKDSTVCLQLALQVARERNKLPLEVVFYDEEVIHPTTIDYVQRVADSPEIKLSWYCLPFKHRNACSRKHQWWYCWNPEEKDLWVRPLPKNAITELKGFKQGMTVPECNQLVNDKGLVMTGMIVGLRTEESMRRYRTVMGTEHDNWIAKSINGISLCKPIYDWNTKDVWLAPGMFGWDYNKTYDLFQMAGMPLNKQRVCPPYGEEPLRGLYVYAQCFPELWHKMLYRVPGVNTAWRYANTDLYSFDVVKPNDLTWKQYMELVLELYNDEDKKIIRHNINVAIKSHYSKSKLRIQEEENDPITGVSWRELAHIAIRGDLKNRRKEIITIKAGKTLNKLGIDYEKAIKEFGSSEDGTRY